MSRSGSRMGDEAVDDAIHRGRHPVADELANNNNKNKRMLLRVVNNKKRAGGRSPPRGGGGAAVHKNHRTRPSSAPPFFKRRCEPPTASSPSSLQRNDPHDLVERYIQPQSEMFDTALFELQQGRKRSCWFWFVLPTAPYMVNGQERGSSTNRHYALRTDAQAEAYLQAETTMGVNLRQNYIDTLAEIECQLMTWQHRRRITDPTATTALKSLLGPLDAVKAISSFRLFKRIARRLDDEGVYTICAKVLKLIDDPYNLVERYIQPQSEMFDTALSELRQGEKRSCWFWFVLPTAPYIVNGEERGSSTNRHYALRTNAQVEAYLKADTKMGVNLRQNYIDTLAEIECQLMQHGSNADDDATATEALNSLLGPVDAVKAISSFRLFERIARRLDDEEVYTTCAKVLKLIDDC